MGKRFHGQSIAAPKMPELTFRTGLLDRIEVLPPVLDLSIARHSLFAVNSTILCTLVLVGEALQQFLEGASP